MRGYSAIGLFQPKTTSNVGSALRAAHCYGAAMVVHTGDRFKKISTDTSVAWKHLPLIRNDNLFDALPYSCVPVAVELLNDARDLTTYIHPESAFYIFGPEDGTLGKAITDKCRDKIYIPTRFCMNLAATVNVVLYDRLLKMSKK